MPLIPQADAFFTVDDDTITLKPEYIKEKKWAFKKITGTSFSGVLGFNHYNSPFQIWMSMVGLYKSVADPIITKTGQVVETKIQKILPKLLNHKYFCYDPKEIKYDAFRDNPVFGGIPDAEPTDDGRTFTYEENFPMVEIKTSSIDKFSWTTKNGELSLNLDSSGLPKVTTNGEGVKRSEWIDKEDNVIVPVEYQFQLSLYLYLRNAKNGVFVISFLNLEDYANPEGWEEKNHEVRMVDFSIKDYEGFVQYIAYAKNWYEEHVVKGKSPKMTKNDQTWLAQQLSFLKAN